MSERLRRRIEELEAKVPTEIVLTLKNGQTFSHCGPSIKFFTDGLDQIRAGKGPIRSALKDTVKAEGCGYMHQMLQALIPPDSEKTIESLTRV